MNIQTWRQERKDTIPLWDFFCCLFTCLFVFIQSLTGLRPENIVDMPTLTKRLQNIFQGSSKIKSDLLGNVCACTQGYWFSCDSRRRVLQGLKGPSFCGLTEEKKKINRKTTPLDHLPLKMNNLVCTVHTGISGILLYYYGPNRFTVCISKKKWNNKAFQNLTVLDETFILTVSLFLFTHFKLQV